MLQEHSVESHYIQNCGSYIWQTRWSAAERLTVPFVLKNYFIIVGTTWKSITVLALRSGRFTHLREYDPRHRQQGNYRVWHSPVWIWRSRGIFEIICFDLSPVRESHTASLKQCDILTHIYEQHWWATFGAGVERSSQNHIICVLFAIFLALVYSLFITVRKKQMR